MTPSPERPASSWDFRSNSLGMGCPAWLPGSPLTASVLCPPSASQTEYIPLHFSGKSLSVTDERETIQQSLNRYRAVSPSAPALVPQGWG